MAAITGMRVSDKTSEAARAKMTVRARSRCEGYGARASEALAAKAVLGFQSSAPDVVFWCIL
jgi:hypothetical protein